jgi:hypothetical protein
MTDDEEEDLILFGDPNADDYPRGIISSGISSGKLTWNDLGGSPSHSVASDQATTSNPDTPQRVSIT